MDKREIQKNRLRIRSATTSSVKDSNRYKNTVKDLNAGKNVSVRIHSARHKDDLVGRRGLLGLGESLLYSKIKRRCRRGLIPGGKAEGKSVADIARKHGKSVSEIEAAIRRGSRIEKEHTTNPSAAREIAKDHVYENPRYYDMIAKIEKIHRGRKKKTENEKEDVKENAPVNNVGDGKIAGTSPGEQPPIRSYFDKARKKHTGRLHRR